MANPLIRKATRSDIEKLVQIRLLLQQHCEESNSLIWWLTDEGKALLRQKVENDFADRNSHILVAELNGEIVGSAHGEVIHRTDYWPKTVGSISTVYVVGKCRRKGVGALLVKQLCEFFEAEGVEDVTLRYIVGNKEAEGFWKKLGFRQVITTATSGLEELISRTSCV